MCEAINGEGLKEATFGLSFRVNRESQGKECRTGTQSGEQGTGPAPGECSLVGHSEVS